MQTKSSKRSSSKVETTVRDFVTSALKARKQFTVREALESYSKRVAPVTIHAVRRICRELKDEGTVKVVGREQNHEVYTFAPVRTKRPAPAKGDKGRSAK